MFKYLNVWWQLRRISSDDFRVRAEAAELLGNLRHVRAMDPLVKALKDKEPHVRQVAATALKVLGDRRAVEPLIRALGDKEECVRCAVVCALGEFRDARAIKPLIEANATKDANQPPTEAIVEAMRKLGVPLVVDHLIRAMSGIGSNNLRCSSMRLLAKLGDPSGVPPLIRELASLQWEFRRAAADALGELGDRLAVNPLIKALGDEKGDVRLHAAEALARLGEVIWKPLIRGDGEDYSRLGLAGDPRAVVPLGDVLAQKSWDVDVRRAAAEALGKLGDPRGVEPLRKALADKSRALRKTVVQSLGHLKDDTWQSLIRGEDDDFDRVARSNDPRAIDVLTAAMQNGSEDAAHALGASRDPRAIESLIKGLAGGTPGVSLVAARSLAKLGDPRAVAPLTLAVKHFHWWIPEVREAVAESLRILNDRLVRGAEQGKVMEGGLRDDSKPLQPNDVRCMSATQPSREVEIDCSEGVKMKLAYIPPGKFMMGSPPSEPGHSGNEGPQHEVTISKPFYMGVYLVTQEQYVAVMGENPCDDHRKSPDSPVGNVSWDEAYEFCKELSRKTGQTVSLPTEAQWEYACRAGTTTKFGFGDQDDDLQGHAWYQGNCKGSTYPVGQKQANAWGLYDMHGNAWEWCADWYSKTYVSAQ